MLTIVDYGVGNLRNVYMAFQRLGLEADVTSKPKDIRKAQAIVLPGVGAFGDAMEQIRSLGLEEDLIAAAKDDKPFLGICVGLQVLFEVSEEMGEHRGLGILGGRVRRFGNELLVPHMGWNQVHQQNESSMWNKVPNHGYAYFVHSYYCDPSDKAVVAGTTDYGIDYASAVEQGNLFAIQFHPEKSQDLGAQILRNFCVRADLLED